MTKKQADTRAILRASLRMVEERLNDRQYAEIWPKLVHDERRVQQALIKLYGS